MRAPTPEDFLLPMLSVLDACTVDLVVAGNVALALHGHLRFVPTLEIAPHLSRENLARLAGACAAAELDAAPDASDIAAGARAARAERQIVAPCYRVPGGIGKLRVVLNPVVPFSALAVDAQTVALSGTPVRYPSLAHLIALKRQAGSGCDLVDIENLVERPVSCSVTERFAGFLGLWTFALAITTRDRLPRLRDGGAH
jgi:hypothetical protein